MKESSGLSRKLAVPASTTHRLLATLGQHGYTAKSIEGKYQLGHKVVELGRTFLDGFQLTRTVRPYLEMLSQKTGETANLVLLDRNEVFYLDRVDSHRILGVFSRIGRRAPLYCTAVGKVFLASFEPERLERYLASTDLKPMTGNTLTSADSLLAEVQNVRARGYACDHEECEVGACCAAVPVVSLSGRTVAAVSVSGPAVRLSDEILDKTARLLQEAAREISALID